jgi:hypothetical protein
MDGLGGGVVRPFEVIKAYWQQVIVIEETAEFLEPLYWEAA